jgi:serine/threonine protein kinase
MTTPKPRLDLFNDSPRLVSKKCRTSTPTLRPPKPPMKSTKNSRRQRSYHEHHRLTQSFDPMTISSTPQAPTSVTVTHFPTTTTSDFFSDAPFNLHEGSFSFGLTNNNDNNDDEPQNQHCRLFRQFDIISKIGSGDFADVYEAKSLVDGQYYAIKRTTKPFTSNSDRLRKLQEVRNHQLLPPHPNCVRYYDSWEEDGYLYIQTELCKTSLNAILENSEEQKLPERLIWKYLLDLLMAVKHLHDHDLIHMDIKPDNIFISFDGVAKLGDFGLMCSCLDLNSTTLNNISSAMSRRTSLAVLTNSRRSGNDSSHIATNHRNDSSSDDVCVGDVSTTGLFNNLHDDEDVAHDDMLFDTNSSFMQNLPTDHDDSGIINRSDESIDSIEEGDSKYLASETMQGKFTKAADIFSLGITIFEVASGLELPKHGKVYQKLRHNEIEDLYFNGLSADLVKIIKMMMEEDYTKRPTIDDLLQLEMIRIKTRRPLIIS